MTSQQIEQSDTFQESPDMSQAIWLKEIAYQLAVQNERFARIEERGVERILTKAGFLTDPADIEPVKFQELYEAARSYMENKTMYPGTSLKHDKLKAAIAAIDGQGFEPPVKTSPYHTFMKVEGNRFCGQCGAGEQHSIHSQPERGIPPGHFLTHPHKYTEHPTYTGPGCALCGLGPNHCLHQQDAQSSEPASATGSSKIEGVS